ncbi:hypothetical protein QO010_004185 [Caulobacter ginsengisoli]|uniref:Chitin-binding type-2 domain-containing protein n=1 Tax=Caulobacter ginsengisoli TaxID=400775 RepID=A0ABU0IWK1_9CAUL|nr:hypothetical protein [Caulobacter ginsengisoli]MDQ0466392.1 hypothetical protein [Caulobacter ginsengisoli]
MRGLIVTLMVLALAGSAMAQEKRITIVAPDAAKAGLRGPAQPAPQPEAPPPLIVPTVPAAPPVDSSACRTACAQRYYFCLSGADDQCPVRWGQCVNSCISPQQP